MSNKTIDEVLAVMCDDTTFSQATTKEEWQQENETQPFAMFAMEEGSPDYSDSPGQFYPPEAFMTTHRFFIKLDGRIYGLNLEGPGDPFSPYSYGINLDRGDEPVVESACSLKCYPMMVEDWLTYYHKVGFDYGAQVNGIEPMVLKSSKSVQGVEADLKKMQDYRDQWWPKCDVMRAANSDEGYRKWYDEKKAGFDLLVKEMADKAKRRK